MWVRACRLYCIGGCFSSLTPSIEHTWANLRTIIIYHLEIRAGIRHHRHLTKVEGLCDSRIQEGLVLPSGTRNAPSKKRITHCQHQLVMTRTCCSIFQGKGNIDQSRNSSGRVSVIRPLNKRLIHTGSCPKFTRKQCFEFGLSTFFRQQTRIVECPIVHFSIVWFGCSRHVNQPSCAIL